MLYSEESEMSSGSYDLLNTTGINGINLLSFHLDSMPYNVTLSRQKKKNQDSTDDTKVCHIGTLATSPPTSHWNRSCTKPVLLQHVNIPVR